MHLNLNHMITKKKNINLHNFLVGQYLKTSLLKFSSLNNNPKINLKISDGNIPTTKIKNCHYWAK